MPALPTDTSASLTTFSPNWPAAHSHEVNKRLRWLTIWLWLWAQGRVNKPNLSLCQRKCGRRTSPGSDCGSCCPRRGQTQGQTGGQTGACGSGATIASCTRREQTRKRGEEPRSSSSGPHRWGTGFLDRLASFPTQTNRHTPLRWSPRVHTQSARSNSTERHSACKHRISRGEFLPLVPSESYKPQLVTQSLATFWSRESAPVTPRLRWAIHTEHNNGVTASFLHVVMALVWKFGCDFCDKKQLQHLLLFLQQTLYDFCFMVSD